MPWFYVDDAFADSKPVMQLDRALRNEAIGLWTRCGAWSAKEETDGRVPLDVVRGFGGTPRVIRALHTQAGLWVESSPDSWRNSREILFGNWEKWQKTRAENEAKRKADAARQSNYRKGKKGRGYVASDTATSDDPETSRRDTTRDSVHGANEPSKDVSRRESQRPDPDPTRPDPLPVVTSGGRGTSVDANRTPRPHCPQHSENSDEPCPKCAARRKWDDAHPEWILQDQLEQKRQLKLLRENCPRCNGTNTYADNDGQVRPCRPHLPAQQEAGHA